VTQPADKRKHVRGPLLWQRFGWHPLGVGLVLLLGHSGINILINPASVGTLVSIPLRYFWGGALTLSAMVALYGMFAKNGWLHRAGMVGLAGTVSYFVVVMVVAVPGHDFNEAVWDALAAFCCLVRAVYSDIALEGP